ncbi:hypothetical protein A2U01_0110919, partial [Trifolium medium]|nr:hypothetical protein [Trifolium medium]
NGGAALRVSEGLTDSESEKEARRCVDD